MNELKTYDFTVFIGRFQPFHLGHLSIVKQALERSKHIIILCGSAHVPRSLRNPWTVPEREQMIRGSFSHQENERISVIPLMDMTYNDAIWVENIQETVMGLVKAHHKTPHHTASIALIGLQKDSSSYYLSLFPQWESIAVEMKQQIDATSMRQVLFGKDAPLQNFITLQEKLGAFLPSSTLKFLESFCKSTAYTELCEEQAFIEKYKKGWDNAPYPPIFVTVDAVVVQSGHVLLVERKARPGKGLLALPGGFINPDEKLIDAVLRELREETKLKIPMPVLKGSIIKQKVFDDPYRSSRGRTITHAFYIALEPDTKLPKIKGGDDAKEALWMPLANLDPSKMFSDHYFIIQNLIGRF